ncbi:MAG: FHA domain-containing protein [bacterium]|nr:FHA domain-containing protein [bacterium]MDO5463172.1 FHA domain-containing protein [bacterium]
MPNITILNGEEQGKTYEWTSDSIRIGRNSANDFVITNASVSGEHCIIEACESGWRVKDLDSTNGSSINSQRITMSNIYRNDVLAVGDISLAFRGDDVPEADPSTVESVDSIPRTTIVMRPTIKSSKPVEGFSKKSETKKTLNMLITLAIIAIFGLAGYLVYIMFLK